MTGNTLTPLLALEASQYPFFPTAAVVDPENPQRMFVLANRYSPGGQYSMLYSSSDGGAHWSEQWLDFSGMTLLRLERLPEETLCVAGDGGVLTSRDGGLTWSASLSCSPDRLVVMPGPPSRVVALRLNQLVISSDGMISWQDPESGMSTASILVMISRWLGTWYSWDVLATADSPTVALAFSCDLSLPHYRDYYDATGQGRIRIRGENLATTGLPEVSCLSLAATAGTGGLDELYLGTTEGIYRGIRGWGTTCTWSRLYPAGGGTFPVRCLSVSPGDPTILFAGTDEGVYRGSTGSVDSWQRLGDLPAVPVRQVLAHPASPSTLYAATADGFFRSADGGASWKDCSGGLTVRDVRALLAHPLNTETLYAGTAGGGVFQSRDRGETWVSLGGPHDPDVRALGFSVHPFTIHAGTASEGEFAFSPSGEYDLDRNGFTDAADLALLGSVLAGNMALNGFRSKNGWLFPDYAERYPQPDPVRHLDLNGDGKRDILDFCRLKGLVDP